ncbi:hypothetical protein F5887DRAFT_927174 [Amanita rubescens]|nr:hypothetical protein F5887DRAFT_927174 [Amanita rubescens]
MSMATRMSGNEGLQAMDGASHASSHDERSLDHMQEPARKRRRVQVVSQFLDLEADAAGDGEEEEYEQDEDEEDDGDDDDNLDEGVDDVEDAQITVDRHQEFEQYINDMMGPYLQRPANHQPSKQASHDDDDGSLMKPPCWLRLCKKHPDFDKGIKRYRADAAIGFGLNDGSYDVLLIPRYRFKFERRGGRPPRRLFNGPGDVTPGGLKARKIGKDTYKFLLDKIFVPFVVKRGVPAKFFEKGKAVRSADVAYFASGMLTFRLNHAIMVEEKHNRFMLISSELFLRSPLEAREKVKVETGTFMSMEGEVVMANHDDDTYSVRVDGKEDVEEVEGVHLRRRFSLGDHVSVVTSLANGWAGSVGFITKLEGGLITVQSRDTKDELDVHGWQLKSYFMSFSHGPAPPRPPMQKFTRDRLRVHIGRNAKIGGRHAYKGTLVSVQDVAGDDSLRVQQRGAQWIMNVPIELLYDEVTGFPLTVPQSFARPLPIPSLPPTPAVGGETPMPEPRDDPEDSVWNPAAPDPPKMIEWDGRGYLANWSTDGDLLDKRILVRIRNTKPQEVPVVMFGSESVENDEGMIKGIESGLVLLHLTRRSRMILMDPEFLIPVMPTNEKQTVVVLFGEHKGQVFKTMKPSKESPSDFPLSPYALHRRKAMVTINAENLARCDYRAQVT